MDRRCLIEDRLREGLEALHVDVVDESHLHAGHAGAAEGGGHFRVTVVSPRFEDFRLLKRNVLSIRRSPARWGLRFTHWR